MNYFAHALPFLDNPYVAAGTGVPDWLTVADRQVRVRMKHAEPFTRDPDPTTAAVARGTLQHLRDDIRFHETRAFAETSLELSAAVRRIDAASRKGDSPLAQTEGGQSPFRDASFRASFVGHLLVEMLLDWVLISENPGMLEKYYRIMDGVDAEAVQAAVNRMAARPTQRLAHMIFLFLRERILWDYHEDDKLFRRLNQVMRRVGFAPLPAEVRTVFPAARQLIAGRRYDLMEGIPVPE